MKNTDYFTNKKITIVGFARSGLACANLLHDLGAQVSITDNNDSDVTRANLPKLKPKDIRFELGRHTEEFVKGRNLVVVSPGVPDTALPIVWARQYRIPVISEVEVASILCPGTIIAVTGTNGKTTVTTLIGKVLEAAGKKAVVCGNIGNPFSGEVDKIGDKDFVALEISSFQLEKIETFKPKIAIILNLSRNHLDRYNSMEEYLAAKKNIFRNQDESDYLILNADDEAINRLHREAKSRAVYFSRKRGVNPNQAAVLAVSSILGIDEKIALNVFKEFKGVEHRLEQVLEINKVKFINDSKSTTVDSAVWALKNTPGPVIMIAGGREKGNDYGVVRDLVKEKVREIILIGEAKDRIAGAFSGILPFTKVNTLEEAVKVAFAKSEPGACVLFSPMCKSFDMFANYEERGKVFKKIVLDLAGARG